MTRKIQEVDVASLMMENRRLKKTIHTLLDEMEKSEESDIKRVREEAPDTIEKEVEITPPENEG